MSKKNLKSTETLICDYCERYFMNKNNLIKHIAVHISQQNLQRKEGLTCEKCNLVFKNRGLLMCHNAHVHEPKGASPKNIESKFKHMCQACQISFFYLKDLKHHIRQYHFNLLSQIPYCHLKKVNQVWFEKVLNSKNIVEIKKVAENMLLMRKLDDNTAMKVSDHLTEVIDLHGIYPTQRSDVVECEYCEKSYGKCYINKHINDIHFKGNNKYLN